MNTNLLISEHSGLNANGPHDRQQKETLHTQHSFPSVMNELCGVGRQAVMKDCFIQPRHHQKHDFHHKKIHVHYIMKVLNPSKDNVLRRLTPEHHIHIIHKDHNLTLPHQEGQCTRPRPQDVKSLSLMDAGCWKVMYSETQSPNTHHWVGQPKSTQHVGCCTYIVKPSHTQFTTPNRHSRSENCDSGQEQAQM